MLSSRDRQRVANDPLVQKVREAVDGTLIDIRPVLAQPPDSVAQTKPHSESEESLLADLEPE